MRKYKYCTNVYLGLIIYTLIVIVTSIITKINPFKVKVIVLFILSLIIGTLIHYLMRWFLDLIITENYIFLKRVKVLADNIKEVTFIKNFEFDGTLTAYSESTSKYVTIAIIRYKNSKNEIKELRFTPENYCNREGVSKEIINFLNKNHIDYSGEIIFYKQK